MQPCPREPLGSMANVVNKAATAENSTAGEKQVWLLTFPELTAALSVSCIGCFLASILIPNIIAACVFGGFGWFIFFDLVLHVTYTYGGEFTQTVPEGETVPRCFGVVSLTYQFIILPILFAAVLILKWSDWDNFYSGKTDGLNDLVPMHIMLALIGYEAKDFLPQRGLNLVFAFHHFVVFLGSYITLTSNVGLGVLICVGVSAEIGSGFYNMDCLLPNRVHFRVLYQILMTASNTFCTIFMVHYFQLKGNPESYRIIYMVCTIALVLLRSVGQCLELKKYFEKPNEKKGEAEAEGVADIENPVGKRPSST